MRYKLKYWFEHGGGCIWSLNENAKVKYGYLVSVEELPLSNKTKDSIYKLEEEYSTYLNWDDPASPSPWTSKQKEDFLCRAQKIYNDLVKELGEDYYIVSKVYSCL